jgi:hypothetical protein
MSAVLAAASMQIQPLYCATSASPATACHTNTAWTAAGEPRNIICPHLTYSTSEAPHTRALDALMSVKAATSRLPGATMYAHPSPRSAIACMQMWLGLDVSGRRCFKAGSSSSGLHRNCGQLLRHEILG